MADSKNIHSIHLAIKLGFSIVSEEVVMSKRFDRILRGARK